MIDPDWHLLQTPGPANLPETVRQAMASPGVNHRSSEFAEVVLRVVAGLGRVAGAGRSSVVVYPSSGTGAWEAALTNVVPTGDTVLLAETGVFSGLWRDLAIRLGYRVSEVPGDWRSGADVEAIRQALADDVDQRIAAVAVVHSETSTGALSDVAGVRAAIDETDHRALLLVDAISSLGCVDYRHEQWRVDVTITGSQKGLMLPPGLGINVVSERALEAARQHRNPVSYWAWEPIIDRLRDGYLPYTPATHLILAADAALRLLLEEGLENVYERHRWMAQTVHRAVRAWGLQTQLRPGATPSPVVTSVTTPESVDPSDVLRAARRHLSVSLGMGLGPLSSTSFRIGHLGSLSGPILLATIGATEAALRLSGCEPEQSAAPVVVDALVDRARSTTGSVVDSPSNPALVVSS